MKLVVIGGVAGGATAATRARRISEDAKIILFERGFYVSYASCGLPYYIGGEMEKRNDLFIASPERLGKRYGIDVRTSQEVVEIDRAKKAVRVKDRTSGAEFIESYDKLLLSPGARSTRPPLPGVDSKKIFTLRDLADTDAIKDYMDGQDVGSAVIVGGGAIGLEAVENFSRRGVSVTVVEKSDQVMPALDYEMATLVHRHLRDQDVTLFLGDGIRAFQEKDGRMVVNTEKGRHIETDLVLLAMGVKPEKELAEKAGLTIGDHGGIVVDEMLCTSDPDIHAIGDAVEVNDLVTGKARSLALAGPANKQGRTAADNIMGRKSPFEGVLGTNVTKIFNMVAASVGEKQAFLEQIGIPHMTSYTHSFHHVSYYPGGKPMAIKLLFGPEKGEILGAQIVGQEGVDKRIDVLAAEMAAGNTVYDLESLELAYAPQFGAAKDPVNIAGYVAANILKGDVAVVRWNEVEHLDADTHVLLDVRTKEEVIQTGTIMDALHIHIDELRDRLTELDRDKTYIAYCTVSLRGYLAYRILTQRGFKCKILSGGLETWSPVQEDREERSAINGGAWFCR